MDKNNERSECMRVEVLNRQGNTWESQSDRGKKAPTEDSRGW